MGLIPCFSSAGFSLRERFKTNRLSVGTTWKWFLWGFIQPSSHHGSESTRVAPVSEVFAGDVGGLDQRWGSHLLRPGFREVVHHLHYTARAYCASSNEIQHQSHQLSPLPCRWSAGHAATGNDKITLSKNGQGLQYYLGEKKKRRKQVTHTFPTNNKKKAPNKKTKTTLTSQLLALALFTYRCTEGIYI